MTTSTPSDRTEAQSVYLAERARNAAAIRDLIRQIAEALTLSTGDPWRYCPPTDGAYASYQHGEICGPEAQELHIRRAHPNRLEIYGSFGEAHHYRPRDERHHITVSATRRPVEISREIARRLLPTYLPSLTKARAAKTAWDEREATQKGLAAELRTLTNGSFSHCSSTSFYFYSAPGAGRRSSANLEVFTDLTISMKIGELTADQARAIIAILRPSPPQADAPAVHQERT